MKSLEAIIKNFLIDYRLKQAEVSLVLIGDRLIRRLNRETRNKDKVTDVLSFRDSDSPVKDASFLGEIFIDYQQIKRQAKKYKNKVRQEFIFIMIHGLLHLVGYDDKTDRQAEKMDELTKKFIAKHKLW